MEEIDDGIGSLMQIINLGIIAIEVTILPAMLLAHYLINDDIMGLMAQAFHDGCKEGLQLDGSGLSICRNTLYILESFGMALGVISGANNIYLFNNFIFIYANSSQKWFQQIW